MLPSAIVRPPVLPTTIVDIRNEIEKKADALACHASQREWLRKHQGVDEYIDAMRRHASARGTLIGAHDLWLAAQAIAGGHAMVTLNKREFARVSGLELEVWA